jgi:hypothetical protein
MAFRMMCVAENIVSFGAADVICLFSWIICRIIQCYGKQWHIIDILR